LKIAFTTLPTYGINQTDLIFILKMMEEHGYTFKAICNLTA